MRQRKVKNLEERILSCGRCFIESASELKGNWNKVFGNENNLYLEIGSGKGNFLIKNAEAHSDRNYVGVEGQRSVVFRALQKLDKTGLDNVRFSCGFMNDPECLFSENEVSGIYLNFSDPWPKKRHAGRRLTCRGYLEKYHRILGHGGFVEVKTDDGALFAFTKNEASGAVSRLFQVAAATDDLHSSDLEARNITTEYEDKFTEAGKKINYIMLVKI